MSLRYEDGWWVADTDPSVAHWVAMRYGRSLLFGCTGVANHRWVRPRLPGDATCWDCAMVAPRVSMVKWLRPSGHDLDCGSCARIIPAGEVHAHQQGPGSGWLLCLTCGCEAQAKENAS